MSQTTHPIHPTLFHHLYNRLRLHARAEAVALLNSLARLPVSASMVAKHAGLVLKLLGDTYGGFVPALIPPPMPPASTTTTTLSGGVVSGGSRAIASPALVLALLKLLQILAGSTQAGGRKALFKAACATLLRDKPGGFVFEGETNEDDDATVGTVASKGKGKDKGKAKGKDKSKDKGKAKGKGAEEEKEEENTAEAVS